MKNSCRLCLNKLQTSDELYFVLDSQICQKFKEITEVEVGIIIAKNQKQKIF